MSDPRTLIGAPAPWMSFAACRDADPDLFFPEQGKSDRSAKAICAICPVRRVCLEYALDNNEAWGIWGGTNGRERRRMRSERARAERLRRIGEVG